MTLCNNIQTPIEELHLDKQPNEVLELFFDFINNVPYIKSLISPNRPHVADLPKDEEGKLIVDVTKPHILENMDYFRPAALKFKEIGKYTTLRPNKNPNSEYYKWLKEEVRRCREGYIRPDGEWITGDYYFFLNYCPIQLIKKDKKGKSIRTIDFPKVWEGHYYITHYLNLARNEGKHAAELASRAKGKSFLGAALLAKRFLLGESEEVKKKVQCVVTASERKYISGATQILDMFRSYIDFCAINTPFPCKKLTDSLLNLQWVSGYEDLDTKTRRGSENSVTGITSKDDEAKLRGSRGVLYLVEEMGCHIAGTLVLMSDYSIKAVENIKVGDSLLGPDGSPREVLQIYSGKDQMYKITLSNGDWQIVNSFHPIRFIQHDWNKNIDKECLLTAPELLQKTNLKGYYIEKAKINYPYKTVQIDPYFLGLWLGDGDSSRAAIANEDNEVLDWLQQNYNGYLRDVKLSSTCKIFHIPASEQIYKQLKSNNLLNNKHVPSDYIYNSKEVGLLLLAGLTDTDGNLYKTAHGYGYEISLRYDRKQILDAAKAIATNLGLRCTLTTRLSEGNKKSGVLHYRLRISGDISIIPVKINRKRVTSREVKHRQRRNWSYYTFKVEPYAVDSYYGFTLDKDHLFILKDGSIVHNTFPRLLALYNNIRPSVEDGESIYGLIFIYGTAGDNESDFSSALEIMYNPKGYRMKALDNVYDKEGLGRKYFTFFFPGYMNRDLCYDDNGNSDVTKALLEILIDRYTVKYNSSDINSITKRIAEIPITPQEAILKSRGNIFPITLLNERLNEIDNDDHILTNHYVGELILNNKGEVDFKPTSDLPIRDFPLKDNKAKGAVELFLLPERDKEGKVYTNRYIAAFDPVDQDSAETMSLTSAFVLDLWTDKLVAEYTGRQNFADDNFEILRLLCLYYNAKCLYESNKKGCFSYFSRMNSLYLLADTPQYLKDKQLIKVSGYGNSSKGVNATLAINNYANDLIREWLLKPVPIIIKQDGLDVETTVPNLHFIESRALLKELILFNPDINVDRVRALGMLMLYREEKMILFLGNIDKQGKEIKSLINQDPFFEENYTQ